MDYQITSHTIGDVEILKFAGVIDLPGGGADAMRDAVKKHLRERKAPKLLLDFSAVTRTDSLFIGELVNAFTSVTNHGGMVKLLNPSRHVDGVLKQINLKRIFEIFDEQNAAIRSFS